MNTHVTIKTRVGEMACLYLAAGFAGHKSISAWAKKVLIAEAMKEAAKAGERSRKAGKL